MRNKDILPGTAGSFFQQEELRENNTLGKGLSEARKGLGLGTQELCRRLERYGVSVQTQTLLKWERGGSQPTVLQFLALCDILGITDPVSSFTGKEVLNREGMARLAEYKKDLIATGRYKPERPKVMLPIPELAASAGTGDYLESEDRMELMGFPEEEVPAGTDFGVRINGDSMEPCYHDRSFAFIQKCDRLEKGEVGLFVLDGKGYIKLLGYQKPENPEEFSDSDGNLYQQPVLISFNPRYKPIEIYPESEFRVVGKVLGQYAG